MKNQMPKRKAYKLRKGASQAKDDPAHEGYDLRRPYVEAPLQFPIRPLFERANATKDVAR